MWRLRLSFVLVALFAVGCSTDTGGDGEASTVDFTAEVSLDESHALVGRLVVEGDQPFVPEISVEGSERSFEIPVGEAATRFELPVAGLRAEHDYTVTVTAGEERVELDLRTDPLPDHLPAIEVVTADGARMSEGFTLFNVLGIDERTGEDPPRAGLLLAVDDEGEVVWYHTTDHPIGDVRQLDDGHLLAEYNDTGARVIDLFGDVHQEWAGQIIGGPLLTDEHGRQVVGDDAIPVATDSMHHEVGMLANGNLVAVSTELRTYDGFSEDLCGDGSAFDGSYDLIVDVIVEFTPDGDIVAEYPLADFLDPVGDPRDQNVCGLPFDHVFPNWLYRAQGHDDALDWTHANSVTEDPTGDAFTVSVRHLDTIFNIDRASGELLWRFGPGGDFDVDHPSDLPSHQHAPEWQDDGTLLVYDNGNERAPGPDGDESPYSRAVQYRLDPDAGTASVVWEFVSTIDGEPAYASFVGDADRLDNGNVLVTNGGYSQRDDEISAQIVEVVPDDSPRGGEIVFELRLRGTPELIVYRAERLATLYPIA